ncbi:PA domain-containing protein [Lentisalinibacter salinarum]|uniref:PA domain-containing protein n=1 Tax=Lentisalinibacter salinarum TaxID=2992239 RepID=UPI0038667439
MTKAKLVFLAAFALAQWMAPSVYAGDLTLGTVDVKIGSEVGEMLGAEAQFTAPLAAWAGGQEKLKGEVVYVGRGCFFDDYPESPAGKIALIERGACAFVDKVFRAEWEGAIGVIVFNVPGDVFFGQGDFRIGMASPSSPPGEAITGIPAVFVGYSDGMALAAQPGKVNIQYKPFTLLKDTMDAIPSLLSAEEKDSFKKLASEAARLAESAEPDFGAAAALIEEFNLDAGQAGIEGKITFPADAALLGTSYSLYFRLVNAL